MGIKFNGPQKTINITSPTKEIAAQELWKKAKEWEASEIGIVFNTIFDVILLPGIQDKPIFILINDWKIKFWSGDYKAYIRGTVVTEDNSPPVIPPDAGDVDVEYVGSYGTNYKQIFESLEKILAYTVQESSPKEKFKWIIIGAIACKALELFLGAYSQVV